MYICIYTYNICIYSVTTSLTVLMCSHILKCRLSVCVCACIYAYVCAHTCVNAYVCICVCVCDTKGD